MQKQMQNPSPRPLQALFAAHDRNFAANRYVYPVLSRRAGGISIGVNLNPERSATSIAFTARSIGGRRARGGLSRWTCSAASWSGWSIWWSRAGFTTERRLATSRPRCGG